MTDWRRSRLTAALIIALFMIVQLAIPISRVSQENARRFGWQMFSKYAPDPEFVVTTADGETEIELADYLAMVRAETDHSTLLPPHLCEVIPGALLVTWQGGSYRC